MPENEIKKMLIQKSARGASLIEKA